MLVLTLLAIFVVELLSIQVSSCLSRKQYVLNFTYINGTADPTTSAFICHEYDHLYIRWKAIDDQIIAPYNKCNDPLYNADAVQAFIATQQSYPTQYFELQISPNSQLFFADIKNPSGNCSQFSAAFQDCTLANYGGKTIKNGWKAWLRISLNVIGRGAPLRKFKMNLFRIDVSSSGATRFLTWKPTFANPPCFHVPRYFETIELV